MQCYAKIAMLAQLTVVVLTPACREFKVERLPFALGRHSAEDRVSSENQMSHIGQCQTNKDDWSVWKQQEISRSAKRSYGSNGQYIYDQIQKCDAELVGLNKSGYCLDNLKRFSRRQWLATQPGHKLGLDQEDGAYLALLADKGYLTLPAGLESQEFLSSLDRADSSNISEIEESIRSLDANWRVVSFRSRNLPTVDNSQAKSRLLIYMSGDSFDRVVQFGVRDYVDAPLSSVISQIIIEKKDASDGRQLEHPVAHLIDLWRERGNSGIRVLPRLTAVKTSEPCYSCHQSALIKIVPQVDSLRNENARTDIEFINQQIKKYGNAKIFGLDRRDLGPLVGVEPGSFKSEQIAKSCIGSFTSDHSSAKRIESAMNCASCHDGTKQFMLQFHAALPSQFSQNINMLRSSILSDRTMPPDASLSDTERDILYQCLVRQISNPNQLSGDLENWLSDSECHQ